MNFTIKLPALTMIFMLFSFVGMGQKINTETVKELDLDRFMGTWYEIARFPHFFEKGLEGVTATYTKQKDGKLKVVNKGYKGGLDGELKVTKGKAKMPDPAFPDKLKVSFFWIFYSDYFVLELDKGYQWAVIGSSSSKYLWILCRTPQMDPAVYEDLLNRIEKRGYDTGKLIRVKHKTN